MPELEPRPLNVKALKSGEQIARGLFEVDGVRILLTEGRTLRSEDINALGTLSSVQPESVLVWYRSRFIESDDPVTMRLSAYYGSLHDIAARREEHVEVDLPGLEFVEEKGEAAEQPGRTVEHGEHRRQPGEPAGVEHLDELRAVAHDQGDPVSGGQLEVLAQRGR